MARAPREPDYDDDAPWLSEVEEERSATTSISQRKLVGGIALFVALLALIVGGLYAITSGQRQDGSSGEVAVAAEDVPLITADAGPYKVRPDDAGGMQIDGAGDTMYAAGEGADVGGALDPGALPEDPMPRPGSAATGPQDLLPPVAGASAQVVIPPASGTPVVTAPPAPRPAAPVAAPPASPVVIAAPKPVPLKPLPKPVVAVPGVPVVKPSGGNSALQLGAFSSSAAADTAWKDMTGRFTYLAGLGKSVGKVERDGRTLYRLRATGVADAATATDLCSRLRVAGEDCIVAP